MAKKAIRLSVQLNLLETKQLNKITENNARSMDVEPSCSHTVRSLITTGYDSVYKLDLEENAEELIAKKVAAFHDWQNRKERYTERNPESKVRYHQQILCLNQDVFYYCDFLKHFYARVGENLQSDDIVCFLIDQMAIQQNIDIPNFYLKAAL